ncbi:MAG: HlyD family efflux transporter periplasmic adaptor subunit, partial [Nitrospirae bacterium]|nr:HlyD family efflux transporter periplasmic adaptor subunit [Nitrospirota bacterium]
MQDKERAPDKITEDTSSSNHPGLPVNKDPAYIYVSPEAADIMEGSPSAPARSLLYILLFIIIAALIWSYYGKTDVTIKAVGILIPRGENKDVVSIKDGVVIELFVKKGDRVVKNQMLAKIGTSIRADLHTQINNLKETINTGKNEILADEVLISQSEKEMLNNKKITGQAIKTKEDLLAMAMDSLKRTNEEYAIYKNMFDNGLISKLELLKAEDALESVKSNITKLASEIDTYKNESQKRDDEIAMNIIKMKITLEKNRTESNEAQRKLNMIEFQYKNETAGDGREAGKYSIDYDVIRSPIDGIVSVSNINHPQDVVKAGNPIFSIIPGNQPLVAKINIPNSGIGRVKVGLPVKFKYDAFRYQEYGVGAGRLTYISPDSI